MADNLSPGYQLVAQLWIFEYVNAGLYQIIVRPHAKPYALTSSRSAVHRCCNGVIRVTGLLFRV